MKSFQVFFTIALVGFLTLGCQTPATENQLAEKKAETPLDWEYQMAYQRGIEAVNWALPAVSMIRYREAHFSLGGGHNTIYYMSKPVTPKTEVLTPNNQTPYASALINTKNGPVVLEIPPASDRAAIFGSAIDIWQVPIRDIGPAGTDQGQGGKYLFLPPGYSDSVPEGYFTVPMDTYNVLVTLRLIPLGGATFEETAEYAMNLNTYPLSQAENPPPGNYIDMHGKLLPALPVFDLSFYQDILTVLNEEPLLERDKVMGGMLASIGIEKGKAFDPDDIQKEALQQAVKDGKQYLDYLFNTPGHAFVTRWPGRQWMDVREPSSDGFVFDEGEYLLLDARAAIFHFAAFAPRRLGKATAYIMVSKDNTGTPLLGEFNYKLTVPPDVPARNFWSVIAYSMDTKAFIYNDADKVGLSSLDAADLQIKEDGSIDIYFSETPPDGLESNWIPTAGEDFFLLFRFYGPQEAFFDKSFLLNDLVKIN